MVKLLALLCLVVFAAAQLDFEDDEPENLLDNTITREMERAIFGDNARTITIFSDFDNPTDRFFFQNVLPWLVDQIGPYLRINYRFRNTARSAGPTACALRSLRTNTYMQAEYLRCEARGNPTLTCIDQAPINRRTYNRCLNRRVHNYVKNSQWDWERLISERTPLVLIGRREVLTNNPARLLRLICQSFGRTQPVGCVRVRQIPRIAPAPNNITSRNIMFDNTDDAGPVFAAAGTNVVAMPYSDVVSSGASANHLTNNLSFQLGFQFLILSIGVYLS